MTLPYRVRRNGRIYQFPDLAHASRRYDAHPDGTGTGWEEDVDVDRPHGLDYRYTNHVAKAVRKRIDKEHAAFGDVTAGGEHTPGYCQVLRQVDGTADVTAAKDSTLFQANGLVHSSGNQTLWCITAAGSDPTVLLIDPDKQYKGGDITWTGAHQFDASVDMTILHVDASLTVTGAALLDGTTNIFGACDMSDTQIDGTLTVLDRADFSSARFSGDVTHTGAMQLDGTFSVNGATRLIGDVTMFGLLSFCSNNLYDSSWFDCTLAGGYTKTHDLSSSAVLSLIYFKDTLNEFALGASRIYSTVGSSNGGNKDGPLIQNITTTQLTVKSGGSMTAYTWTAAGGVVTAAGGQYRVIALRLI